MTDMMQAPTLRTTTSVQAFRLHAQMDVRYWEDAEVDGRTDSDGTLIPFRKDDCWDIVIDLRTGIIENWPTGVTASIHYKICDAGRYALLDEEGREIAVREGYVPAMLSPGGNGFGDYVIAEIDGKGRIPDFKADLEGFATQD